jgi:predicted small secreted protein
MSAITCKVNLMMKLDKPIVLGIALALTMALLSACQKQEGPAEKAGKELDKAMDQAGQQIEKAGEKIQDTANDAKK